MVLPSPESVAAAVVEAAMVEARRVGVDWALIAPIVADSEVGLNADVGSPPEPASNAPSVPVGWVIGVAQQLAESRNSRRSRGAFYTPFEVADGLVGLVVDGPGRPVLPRVCDPTCGAGWFLLCAAERLFSLGVPAERIGPSLVGYDIDPVAILTARLSLGLWLAAHGGDVGSPSLHVHDALHGAEPPSVGLGFDVVVGNPPFLGQLRRRSARTGPERQSLSSTRGYADAAFVALERSLDWISAGGRIALIQPQSVLAARDAAAVRARIDVETRLFALWVGDETIFDAAVQVCAPVVEKRLDRSSSGPVHARLTTYRGAAVEISGQVDFTSWPELLADIQGVPKLTDIGVSWANDDSGDSLSSLAAPTADFRDWFYWIASKVGEAEPDGEPGHSIPVFTSGLIDPLAPLWGLRPARIGGKQWKSPRIEAGVAATEAQATKRLVPKVLIANQTRSVEAVVDFEGRWLPNTPVITVVPIDQADLWRVAAVILAPVSTVAAHRAAAGSGMSSGAVRLTAKIIGRLPLPRASAAAWEQAAGLLEVAARSELAPSVVRDHVVAAGRLMLSAYGLGDRRTVLAIAETSWSGGFGVSRMSPIGNAA